MVIKGIDIQLINLIENGKDEFNQPFYTETAPITIKNVLVSPLESSDVIDGTSLLTEKLRYQLAIPKGDDHRWANSIVVMRNNRFKTVGEAIGGIESMIPLDWNKKVVIERYE